jgi:hypothetical protein
MDERNFLQFNIDVIIEEKMQTIIGWAHPELIFLVKGGPTNIFIDCTFRVVPHGFTQLMIIMVYSSQYKMYAPVFFILLQSKFQATYYHALQQPINSSEWTFSASSVTCDFEKGLLGAVKEQFPEAPVIGCNFHWKQAIRRKLLENHIPVDMVSELMGSSGLINILPLLNPLELSSKGIMNLLIVIVY